MKKIKKLMTRYQKPIIIIALTENELLAGDDFVIYSMPEQATLALKKLYDYYQFRSNHEEKMAEN